MADVGFIHTRVRPGRDDDIATWYEAQKDKSEAVREAIRLAIRLQNGESQEVIVKEVVARELARLPDVVAMAVREALASYQLVPGEGEPETDPEAVDPEALANYAAAMDDWEV